MSSEENLSEELIRKVNRLEDKVERQEQKIEHLRSTNKQGKNTEKSDKVSRRKFMKLIGLGAGGLAFSSAASAGFLKLGNDIVDGGNTIWDRSNSEVPKTQLGGPASKLTSYPLSNTDIANSSITVAGNSVSLGSSIDLNHSDLLNIGTDDHHEAPSGGSNISIDGTNTISVSPQGSGSNLDADKLDGEDSSAFVSTSGGSMSGDLDLSSGDKISLPHRESDPSANPGDMWYRTDLD